MVCWLTGGNSTDWWLDDFPAVMPNGSINVGPSTFLISFVVDARVRAPVPPRKSYLRHRLCPRNCAPRNI